MLDMEDRIVKLERWQNQHTDPHKADQAIEHYRQEAVAVEKKYATLLKAMKKIVAFDYVAIPQVGIMDKITMMETAEEAIKAVGETFPTDTSCDADVNPHDVIKFVGKCFVSFVDPKSRYHDDMYGCEVLERGTAPEGEDDFRQYNGMPIYLMDSICSLYENDRGHTGKYQTIRDKAIKILCDSGRELRDNAINDIEKLLKGTLTPDSW